jgi:hypothetical protein
MRGRLGKCGEIGVGRFSVERIGARHGRVDGGVRRTTRDRLAVGIHRLSSMDGNLRSVRISWKTRQIREADPPHRRFTGTCRRKVGLPW